MAINDRRKQKIRDKATAQAQKAANSAIRPVKQQKQSVRRAYRKDVRSAQGASKALINVLNKAMGNVTGQGLSGRSEKQILTELAAMQGDAAKMARFEANAARVERNDALQPLNEQIAGIRAEQPAAAKDIFREKLEAIRARQEENAPELKSPEDRAEAQDLRQASTVGARNFLNNVANFASTDTAGLSTKDQAKAEAAKALMPALLSGDRNAIDTAAQGIVSDTEGVQLPEARAALMRILQKIENKKLALKPSGLEKRQFYDVGW